MKRLLFPLVAVLVFSVSAYADIYKCTDANDNLIFTDQPQDPRCQIEVKQKPSTQRSNEPRKSNSKTDRVSEGQKQTTRQVINNKIQSMEENQEIQRQNEIEKAKQLREIEREQEERDRKADKILSLLDNRQNLASFISLAATLVRAPCKQDRINCSKADDIAEEAVREYNLPIQQRYAMLKHAQLLKGY